MASHIEIAEILKKIFPNNYRGILLEVGAAHPTEISISFLFRPLGWKIISIEPNPDFVEEFKKLGLECLPYACCAEDRGKTDFHVSPCPMSASAIEVRYPGNYPLENGVGGWWPATQFKTISVEALTLNTIMKKHYPEIENIDILIVDTEGWEIEVLRGFDLKKFNPKVIILEDASPQMITENMETISYYQSYMKSCGYSQDREELQDKFYIRN